MNELLSPIRDLIREREKIISKNHYMKNFKKNQI